MTEKLVLLKQQKPVLFYLALSLIAIPLVIFAIISLISPAIRSWLVSSAERLLNSSKAENAKIESEIEKIENQIGNLDKKDQELKNKLDQIDNSEDTEWHKRIKR